ncbi:MAG: FadR family transcriptional regulator [Limnohabitans sp.]|jgi:DNA-binding FadR family transcriptional regulator|nr:FadR family transcriptional regulator [Limnohabitans sp.]
MIKNVFGSTVDLLGEAIVSARYPVGESLPAEPLLCEELGVSRSVLREAVKSLVAKGLLTTGPKVGTRVMPEDQWNWFDPDVIAWLVKKGLPREFVRDLQDLRRVVEPAAVRLAAQRADAQDLAAIESAYAGMKHAVEQGGDDYITHDLRFHQSLLRASRNRMLAQMSEVLSALLRTSFEISTRKDNGPASSLSMHREVLDAVSARQPERAEQVILRLIDSARQDIDDVLSSPRPARSRQAPAAALAS